MTPIEYLEIASIAIAALAMAIDEAIRRSEHIALRWPRFRLIGAARFVPAALVLVAAARFIGDKIGGHVPGYISGTVVFILCLAPIAWLARADLRHEQFSRFVGGAVYLTDPIMTDRQTYPQQAEIIQFAANVARDVDALRVFVQHSWITERGQWTERSPRLPIAEHFSLSKGQRVFVPVLTRESRYASLLDHPRSREAASASGISGTMKWGDAPLDDKPPSHQFNPALLCRARLVIRGDDGKEQYHYFVIVTPPGGNSTPLLVDQGTLGFPDRWLAQDRRRD